MYRKYLPTIYHTFVGTKTYRVNIPRSHESRSESGKRHVTSKKPWKVPAWMAWSWPTLACFTALAMLSNKVLEAPGVLKLSKGGGGKGNNGPAPAWTVKLLKHIRLICSIYLSSACDFNYLTWQIKHPKINIESEKWWIGRCFCFFFPRGVFSGFHVIPSGCRSLLLHPHVHPCGCFQK